MPALSVKAFWEQYKGKKITAEEISKTFNISFDKANGFLKDCSIYTPQLVLKIRETSKTTEWWVIDTEFHNAFFKGKGWLGGK